MITAGDINKNNQIEISNPQMVIANITDMSGKLKMDIFVSQGRGYEMIENKETKSKEIGYIEMDSIFSPILSTGITIENVRVGKITNWDKLILDILTDGTITFKDAFEEATKILIAQFKSILSIEEETELEKVSNILDMPAPNDEMNAENTDNKAVDVDQEKNIASSENSLEEPKKRRGRPKKS
jgi:DNA-directed RNA polymerase subunit alpha